MQLILVGTGGSAVGKKRACPSFLVDGKLLLDCGPGALRNLRLLGVNLGAIERLMISHFHADHIGDVVPLLWAMQIDGRTDPLTIYGPPGVEHRIRALLEIADTAQDFLKFSISFLELRGKEVLDDLAVSVTGHKVTTLACRIRGEGATLCYSSDTPYSSNVVELARKADALIHEATFLEAQKDIAKLTGHSTASDAGLAARAARVGRLIIFHIPPPYEGLEGRFLSEASQKFPGETIVGEDLREVLL